MLRSMLYVRYGSGCSRRVTASAARPSVARSCDSKRANPSAGVSRSPATALASNSLVGNLLFGATKFDSRWGQVQFACQAIEKFQALSLALAQVEIQVVAQIVEALGLRQAQGRRLALGNLDQVGHALIAGFREGRVDALQIGPGP